MLVIRRRAGEILSIGPDIQIEILEIAGNQVKLGIAAPREVVILRNEIRMTREQNESASRGVALHALDAFTERLRRR
jgi:carbon storage regulator